MKKLLGILVLGLLWSNFGFAIDLKIPKSDDEWLQAYNSLHWKDGPINLNFPQANSTVEVGSNYQALEDEEANQWLYWQNGVEFPNTKIYVVNLDHSYTYTFRYYDSGYVKTDDWTKVDPDEFIKQIRKNYKAANSERKKNNQLTILSVDWLYKPYLDKNYDTVYYALKVKWSDNSYTIQGTAILLGREGYTEADYVVAHDKYQESKLINLSKMHRFNNTKEYKDWKSGDKVAAAGIGALLAATLGVKALKPGIIAAALLLLKKFWFIIFLPLIWIGKLFTRSSKNKKK